MCGHGWIQQRQNTPKRSPQCRSTLWNREPVILLDDDDERLETIEEDDDSDLEIIDEDDDSGDDVYEEDDEDGDIYDEDTGEIVGRSVNGVITWKDTK
jgi:hypothetical protein